MVLVLVTLVWVLAMLLVVLLREAILNRTCGTHKTLQISLFFCNNVRSYLLWSPVIVAVEVGLMVGVGGVGVGGGGGGVDCSIGDGVGVGTVNGGVGVVVGLGW